MDNATAWNGLDIYGFEGSTDHLPQNAISF